MHGSSSSSSISSMHGGSSGSSRCRGTGRGSSRGSWHGGVYRLASTARRPTVVLVGLAMPFVLVVVVVLFLMASS